jgi:hypothetical protein
MTLLGTMNLAEREVNREKDASAFFDHLACFEEL